MSIHPTADVHPSVQVGVGSRIWHEVQIREGARLGAACIVGKGSYIDHHVVIGDRVKIQNRVSIYYYAEIENGVFLGPHCCLTNDRLPRAVNPDGSLKTTQDWQTGRIYVREGASIGAGAIILTDVTIGRWALVGAGALVTRDVPDHGLVAGVPACLVGYVCRCANRLQPIGAERWRCQACTQEYNLPTITSAGDDLSCYLKD